MTKEEFFLHILSALSEIHGSSLRPSSHNCFDRENSFIHPVQIQESFQFDFSKAIISGLFILSFQLSFSNFTGASSDL